MSNLKNLAERHKEFKTKQNRLRLNQNDPQIFRLLRSPKLWAKSAWTFCEIVMTSALHSQTRLKFHCRLRFYKTLRQIQNVDTVFDDSICHRGKTSHFGHLNFFSCKLKCNKLSRGPLLPPSSWRSPNVYQAIIEQLDFRQGCSQWPFTYPREPSFPISCSITCQRPEAGLRGSPISKRIASVTVF